MTSLATVQKAQQGVAKAIAACDWLAADRGVEFLAGAWLRAASVADPVELEKVASGVHKLRTGIITAHDIPQKIGPEQIAWMLAGVSSVLKQARRPERLTGHNTQGRILEALFLANGPMSTGDLAKRVNRAAATVARQLPTMRAARLVASRQAGSQTLNVITEAGRAMHRSIDKEEQAGVRLYPTTLSKRHSAPKPTVGIPQLVADFGRPDSQPNDLCAIVMVDIR